MTQQGDGQYPRNVRTRVAGVVRAIRSTSPAIQEVDVDCAGESRTAVAYRAMTGTLAPGDAVQLNTVAVELGLGTGGVDFVVAGPASSAPAECAGHILKLRYTPVQTAVMSVEAQESPDHDQMAAFTSLDGMPVVCCELHSQVAPACFGISHAADSAGRPRPRVVYVMTDGAALPLALSRSISELRGRGYIAAAVTAGNAFGGEVEAMNIYSGLAAARAVRGADVVVVGQGPGAAGTGTELGFSGVDQAIAVNAVLALGGSAVAVPRVGERDRRDRHVGLSHHTTTVLGCLALGGAYVPVAASDAAAAITAAIHAADGRGLHTVLEVDVDAAFEALSRSGLELSTMGRGVDAEPLFYKMALAAGITAANMHHSGGVPSP